MKKVKILLSFVALITFTMAQAQEIGLRFGDVAGNNVAIDGIFGANWGRTHANVSFGEIGVGMDAIWEPIYKPLGGEAFNWYAGVGPSALIGDVFFLGVSGEVGLAYEFNTAPISLSLDYRPTFWIIEETDFSAGGFGFNVRYVF